MKEKLFLIARLAIVMLWVANTQIQFLTGWPDRTLLGLTALVVAYEVIDGHKKIKEHRQSKKSSIN